MTMTPEQEKRIILAIQSALQKRQVEIASQEQRDADIRTALSELGDQLAVLPAKIARECGFVFKKIYRGEISDVHNVAAYQEEVRRTELAREESGRIVLQQTMKSEMLTTRDAVYKFLGYHFASAGMALAAKSFAIALLILAGAAAHWLAAIIVHH